MTLGRLSTNAYAGGVRPSWLSYEAVAAAR